MDVMQLTEKKSRFHDDTGPVSELTEMTARDETPEEAHFRQSVFYPIIDIVTSGLTVQQRQFAQSSNFYGHTFL